MELHRVFRDSLYYLDASVAKIVNFSRDVTVTYTRSPVIQITGRNDSLPPVILRGFQVP